MFVVSLCFVCYSCCVVACCVLLFVSCFLFGIWCLFPLSVDRCLLFVGLVCVVRCLFCVGCVLVGVACALCDVCCLLIGL